MTAQAVDVELSTVAQSVAAVGEPEVEDAAFITAPTEDGPAITGTVTFTAFGPNDATCSGATVFTSTRTITANDEIFPGTVIIESASTTFNAAGIYRWVASYSGNANYNQVTAPCNAPEEQTYVFESSESLIMLTDTESDVVAAG